MRRKTVGLVGALALIGLLSGAGLARAGGCRGGGGSFRGGGYGGGHTFGRAAYAGCSGGGMSCCSGGGMQMGMAAMPMAPAPAYGGSMQGMPMNGYAAPAPAAASAARYTCPMHPGVVSATPGSCPYCGMALSRR